MLLTFLFKRRAAFPICLTLGVLLCALPALADAPAVPTASVAPAQILRLQHTLPAEIFKVLHWDQGANLPEGVTRITAQTKDSALLIVSTPDGFARVREIVTLLDFAPRQVEIKFVLATATTADLETVGLHSFDLVPLAALPAPPVPIGSSPTKVGPPQTFIGMITGKPAAQFLAVLTKRGAVLQAPVVTTTNNVDASISITDGRGLPILPKMAAFRFAATPRVNSDGSVTLNLHPSLTRHSAGTAISGGLPITQEVQTLRTVKSGEMMLLINVFPGATDSTFLLFVTPTILPDKNVPPVKPKLP